MKIGVTVGIPKETGLGETRVAATPDSVKRLMKCGFDLNIETGAGVAAGFLDSDYEAAGAKIVSTEDAWSTPIVAKIAPPTSKEAPALQSGAMIVSLMEPFRNGPLLEWFAQHKVDALALEAIPRTSRAQSMDVLSSQAGIAGYRAVLEAAQHYGRKTEHLDPDRVRCFDRAGYKHGADHKNRTYGIGNGHQWGVQRWRYPPNDVVADEACQCKNVDRYHCF